MRAVIQRVNSARVMVNDDVIGSISRGLVVFLGVTHTDGMRDIQYLCEKIVNLRIFEDENGKMNLSLIDVKGKLLVVSQFTLYGDCKKGRRPGFDEAARPELAEDLYNKFIEQCGNYGIGVEKGKFQAEMLVEIHNDGPVTILLDSNKVF